MADLKKILFFADAQLGDLLLLTPALKALKNDFPDSEITLLLLHRRYYSSLTPTEITKSLFEGTSQVYLNNSDADEIFELDRQAIRSLKGIKRINAEFKCIRQLRKMKFDAMVCTFPQSRFVLWSFLTGCPVRVGQKNQPFSYLLTHTSEITAKQLGVLKYYYCLVKLLGVNTECRTTVYNVTDSEKKLAENLLKQEGIDLSKKIVFVHPGASGPYKVWPPSYFSKVIDHILDKNLSQVIICSNNFDKAIVKAICKTSANKLTVLNLESIRELAAVISLSTLTLVNNSGPRHVSAAVGVKSVPIFQKYDDGEWRTYDDKVHQVAELHEKCPVCNNNKCESLIRQGQSFGSECMWLVPPEVVISKITDILQKNG